MGGGGYQDLWYALQSLRAGDTFVLLGDMGDDPLDWSNPWGFTPQGGPPFVRDATSARYGGALVIPSTGGGDVASGPGGSGEVCLTLPEHHHPIYRDSSDIEAVSGGGAASGKSGST